jgi:hypothetical protein
MNATVLLYRDDGWQPSAELALKNGDRILISFDQGGLTISRFGDRDPRILFQADSGIVGHLCAALVESPKTLDATPLRLVVAAAVQLSSADEVEKAFRNAAAQVS